MNLADLPDRIAAKVAIDTASGCWLWTGTIHHGYAYMRWQNGERTHAYAHRLTYHLLVDATSPISGGGRRDQIDHVADLCTHRPTCVNPLHMQRVSARVNSARSKMRAGTESPFVGVRRSGGSWRALIQVNGDRLDLGTFASEVDAARAYDDACVLHGDVAVNAAHGLIERAA